MRRLSPVLVAVLLAMAAASAAGQTAGERVAVDLRTAQQAEAAQAAPEVLAEVRVHGNYATPDAEVLRLAGLTIGQPIDAGAIEAATRRLKESGRFEEVEIRKRYRSLEPGSDVALVIVVREHPIPEKAMEGPAIARPFRRLWASQMVLPILSYTDGYGFTYGARLSFVDLVGRGSRISVPLSWGGTRRAAVEITRPLFAGPFDELSGGVSVSGRTNPFYELDENREDAWIGASRRLTDHLRAGGRFGVGHVRFGEIDEDVVGYGANATFDTRRDPVFPRNAVFASAGWERLQPSRSASVNRFEADVRGYRGLVGQSVLSVRVQYEGADGPQPLYARYLLGGASSLRGYRAGSFSGDNLLGATAELRVPLNSPMSFARIGVTLFADTGTVWDSGARLSDARFRTGGGAGVFLLASLFQVNLDVGFREGGGARMHFTTGLQF
jgi:outer membrane protein assembly factor BamA